MKNYIKHFRSYMVQDASFLALLIMMIFIIFILPALIELENAGRGLLDIMLLALFFTGIWSTTRRWLIIVSSILFGTILIFKVIRYSGDIMGLYLVESFISGLNVIVFIVINFNLLFRDDTFNFDRVLGAINVYLLLALLGAFLFEMIQMVLGSSIAGNIDLDQDMTDFVHYIYFSLVSLTTVGFGDIYPANQASRMLSVALAAMGILYPAVVIARLVSQVSGSGKQE